MTMAPDEAILSLRDIRKTYGGQEALKGVSLDVKRGEVVAIIGPSGSGKSTLLRCINQLEVPDSGSLHVLGEHIDFSKRISHGALMTLRRKVGMVFQSFNLFPHMSVLRNVSFPQQRVLGRSREDADRRSRELLERVGLGAKVDAYPQKCSGGQQQRVAIARALALDPEVMLFDEPTSALDPELGLEVLAVMRQLANAGMTMIVVTHEIHFAAEVADRLIVMADGAILEEGEPKELIASPQTPRARTFLSAITDR
jgi:polar amino acid transport system ATP-binding protein